MGGDREKGRQTSSTNTKIQCPVRMLDYYWGYGGEGTFSWGDVVYWRGDETECIRNARNGKVVHFVVHDDAWIGLAGGYEEMSELKTTYLFQEQRAVTQTAD